MAAGFTLTLAGADEVEAAYQAGRIITIQSVVIGDGGNRTLPATADARAAMTALAGEFGREPFSRCETDTGFISGQLIIDCKNYPGRTVRELGWVSSSGTLIAYGVYPETFLPEQTDSIIKELIVEMVLTLEHASNVTLNVDITRSRFTQDDADALYLRIDKNLADVNNAEKSLKNIGGVPTTRKINNHELKQDITLTHEDVGAAATIHKHKWGDIEDVPDIYWKDIKERPEIGHRFAFITEDRDITVPDGVYEMLYKAIGGGGGGGGGSNYANPAEGGKAARLYVGVLAVTPGEVIQVRIGAGGTGGQFRRVENQMSASGLPGGDGGDTTFGSVVAKGAPGGAGSRDEVWGPGGEHGDGIGLAGESSSVGDGGAGASMVYDTASITFGRLIRPLPGTGYGAGGGGGGFGASVLEFDGAAGSPGFVQFIW